MASGFFWSAFVSIVDLLLDVLLGRRALERDAGAHLVASSSAPFLTACQNWCWKPLETMAMYGLSPLAATTAAGGRSAALVVGAARPDAQRERRSRDRQSCEPPCPRD